MAISTSRLLGVTRLMPVAQAKLFSRQMRSGKLNGGLRKWPGRAVTSPATKLKWKQRLAILIQPVIFHGKLSSRRTTILNEFTDVTLEIGSKF